MTAGRKINSSNKNWGTPIKYVNVVKEVFGGEICLDPCSNEWSIVNAKIEFIFPEYDGLKEEWNYPTVYVNPPYGNNQENHTSIKDWLCKCAYTSQVYKSEVIALIPVATNTSHWKKYIWGVARAVCFLYDTRLRFLEFGNDTGKGAPMSCAMVYWGSNYTQFFNSLIKFGAVIDLLPIHNTKIGSIIPSQLTLSELIEDIRLD